MTRFPRSSVLFLLCALQVQHQSVIAYTDVSTNNIRQRRLTDAATEEGDTNNVNSQRGPVQVGDAISTNIGPFESSALPPIESKANELKYEIIFRPGAPYTTVHFAQFDMGDLCHMVVIGKDLPDGRAQKYKMEGKGKLQLGEFWTQHVKGDTMWLNIFCPDGYLASSETSFQIDQVAVGFLKDDDTSDERGFYPESQCGTADFQNVACLAGTEQYQKSRAIARLLVSGTGWCTGWLISANNHFITNEHCISSQTQANNVDFDFGAEAPTCSTQNCRDCFPGTVYSGSVFIQDDQALDYALLQLTQDPASIYGFLEVDDRDPQVGERIYIVQHPARRAKEVSITSTHPDDNGNCLVHSTTMRGCTSNLPEIGYYCDTEGGSSGSPILSYWSNKVVALHHCGGCLNLGVPMNKIWAQIAPLVTGSPAPTSSPGAPTPAAPTASTPPYSGGGEGSVVLCWDSFVATLSSFFSW